MNTQLVKGPRYLGAAERTIKGNISILSNSRLFFFSRQGSWKTGEKENGSSEEEKKLEEKVEENSQKAEV